jgi:hypothetical protein
MIFVSRLEIWGFVVSSFFLEVRSEVYEYTAFVICQQDFVSAYFANATVKG